MDSNEIPALYERILNKVSELAISHAQLAGIVSNNTKDIADIKEDRENVSEHKRSFWSSLVGNIISTIIGVGAGYLIGKLFH